MGEIVLPGPLIHQREVDESSARRKLLPWGRRTGKTEWASTASVIGHGPTDRQGNRLRPGIISGMDVVWVARDNKQNLTMWENDIKPRFEGVAGVRVNSSDRFVDLKSIGGGTLWVKSMENIHSVRGIGKNLIGVVFEEAAHLDLQKALLDVIVPTLADNWDLGSWWVAMSTTNAGQDGNPEKRAPSYFNLLVDRTNQGQMNDEYFVCHRTARDNPKITPAAFQAMCDEYPDKEGVTYLQEVEARILMQGAGAAFPEWRPDLHISKHEPQPYAEWFAGMDWGYTSPGCLTLFASDGDHVQARWEFKFERMTAYDVGYTIGLRMQEWPLRMPQFIATDPSMWAKDQQGGSSIAEELQRGLADAVPLGRPAVLSAPRGPGSRIQGKMLFHQALRYKADGDGTVPSWNRPRLTFHPDCRYLINTIPKLPRDPKNPEDVDTTADDHGYDSARYGIMAREPQAERPPADVPENRHPGFTASGKRRARDRTDDVVIREELEDLAALGQVPGGRYGYRGIV